MKQHNPEYTSDSSITLNIEHPIYGWIPFTASPNDPEGLTIYNQAISGDFGVVKEFTPEVLDNNIIDNNSNIFPTPPSGEIATVIFKG